MGDAIYTNPFMMGFAWQRGLLPLASLTSTIPLVAVAPIAVMWFGFEWPSKAAVVVLMTFFPMLVSTLAGLQASGKLVDAPWEYHRIDDCGHWIPLQRPEAVTAAALDWFARHPLAPAAG